MKKITKRMYDLEKGTIVNCENQSEIVEIASEYNGNNGWYDVNVLDDDGSVKEKRVKTPSDLIGAYLYE